MKHGGLPFGAFSPLSVVLQKARWVRGLLLLAVVMAMGFATGFAQTAGGNGLPYPPPAPGEFPMNLTANPTADANRLMEDSMKAQDETKRYALINAERQSKWRRPH